jgi:hypothetical protein
VGERGKPVGPSPAESVTGEVELEAGVGRICVVVVVNRFSPPCAAQLCVVTVNTVSLYVYVSVSVSVCAEGPRSMPTANGCEQREDTIKRHVAERLCEEMR